MKKLLLVICIIALSALLLSGLGERFKAPDDPTRFTSVSEAAFSLRNSGAEDATSFLVGSFAGERGEKLCFTGDGAFRRVKTDLSDETGSCSLMQSADGAIVLELQLDGSSKLYAFRFASPEGAFTLTDQKGSAETFTPVTPVG